MCCFFINFCEILIDFFTFDSRRSQNGRWRCCLYEEMELSSYVFIFISLSFPFFY
jgi:hypothetical protein